MQTFMPYMSSIDSAKVLDTKRLNKQRIEALQIVAMNLDITEKSNWGNHPAVLMWKPYIPYLIKDYIFAMINEWKDRNLTCQKCLNKFLILYDRVKNDEPIIPHWLNDDFCNRHRSKLFLKGDIDACVSTLVRFHNFKNYKQLRMLYVFLPECKNLCSHDERNKLKMIISGFNIVNPVENHYKKYWPNQDDTLDYYWPVTNT